MQQTNNTSTIDIDGVGIDNGNYFGFDFEIENSQLVIISAPWDTTVSYGDGTRFAPDAIIEASTQLDFFDELAPLAWQKGIATAPIDYSIQDDSMRARHDAVRVIEHLECGGKCSDDAVVRKIARVNEASHKLNKKIYDQATTYLDMNKCVALVGGDHSTPYGLIKALGERHESFGILHIDAHCDLREAYEGFEHSHASIMYNSINTIPSINKLVQVAIRDYSATEAKLAADHPKIELFSDLKLAWGEFEGETWGAQCRKIIEHLPQKVYISFDIDGLSLENCQTTGTPVAGGLSFNKALFLIEMIASSGRQIIGFDVVEVAPKGDDSLDAMVGARILWRLCGQTLRSQQNLK